MTGLGPRAGGSAGDPAGDSAGDPAADPLSGTGSVLVAGAGVSALPAIRYLRGVGRRVLVFTDRGAPTLPADLADDAGVVAVPGLVTPPPEVDLVITSPGFPPTTPVLRAAADAGLPVLGEVELAWRLDHRDAGGGGLEHRPRPWLVVTGSNGKTTTVGMLEAILRAAGREVTACGNVGWAAVEAVLAGDHSGPRQDVIAAELSSFQLHWSPSVHPAAGLVLNVVEDHLDWYGGSMAAYAADKARALTGDVAVAVIDDPGAAALLARASAAKLAPITAGPPSVGGLGVRDGMLVDEAFGAGPLLPVGHVRPAGAHNLTNALGAAALALAAGVSGADVAAGLASFVPGAHRNTVIARIDGVDYADDSKATNPHAALASLTAYPRVVWIAGGQLKGAAVDELVIAVQNRLAGVVLIGVDTPVIEAALSRHAPDVPRMRVPGTDHRVMTEVVRAAARMAAVGDTVLLAPAAASLDMFDSYAARGAAFAQAVAGLRGLGGAGLGGTELGGAGAPA